MLDFPGFFSPKRWRLRQQAVGLAIALGTLPVLLIGGTAYFLANRSITQKELQFRQAQAAQLEDKVTNFLAERYGDLNVLSHLPILTNSKIVQVTSLTEKQAVLDRYLDAYGIYDSIAIGDLQGKTTLQSSGSEVTGLAERDYFQAVLKTEKPVVVPPRKSALTGEWAIFMAAPVRDSATGKMIGILRTRIPIRYLADNIKALSQQSEGAEYQIVDATGKFVINPDQNQIGTLVADEYPFIATNQALAQPFTRIATSQVQQVEKLVAIAPMQDIRSLPNLRWFALVDVETNTAFATQRRLLTTLLIGTGTTALIISAIAVALANQATQSLKFLIGRISNSTTAIATMMAKHEQTVNQQASAVTETTTTMNELSAAAQQSVEQAEAAATGAQQVLGLVNHQNQTAHEGESLQARVNQIAEQILNLSQQTHQIGTISTLVSDLATQTNMLALNAAVEAARAGEHGKGFGVVATEIRKLADQSRKSAEQIQRLVTGIQHATHSTVMVTEAGTKTVEKIVGAVNTITLNSQQISLTARQQALAIQQVLDSMNLLSHHAEQATTGLRETKTGVQALNETASDLKAIV